MVTVFASGCWDLLHSAHLEFLEYGRSQGDRLIVSIASDETLRQLKREPIIREHDRYLMIKALRCVDECFVSRSNAGWDDCVPYVKTLRPNKWLLDSDDEHINEKREIAKEINCEIIIKHRVVNSYSTTKIIQGIKCSA